MACDTWNTEFTELDPYRGLNANMHTVEAFLAAADVTGDEKYRMRCGRIIKQVIGWASDNEWRIPEHYTSNWERIWSATRLIRMISSNHMGQHRGMVWNGRD